MMSATRIWGPRGAGALLEGGPGVLRYAASTAGGRRALPLHETVAEVPAQPALPRWRQQLLAACRRWPQSWTRRGKPAAPSRLYTPGWPHRSCGAAAPSPWSSSIAPRRKLCDPNPSDARGGEGAGAWTEEDGAGDRRAQVREGVQPLVHPLFADREAVHGQPDLVLVGRGPAAGPQGRGDPPAMRRTQPRRARAPEGSRRRAGGARAP